MGTKSGALANRIESTIRDALTTVEKLNETEWAKTTEAEKWPVGVTAHHLAGALEAVSDALKKIVAGEPLGFTMDMIHEMNARHAREYANCTRAETVEMLKKGGRVAAETVRRLTDDQLLKGGTFGPGGPTLTAEQLINMGLIGHAAEHLASIRKTVGK